MSTLDFQTMCHERTSLDLRRHLTCTTPYMWLARLIKRCMSSSLTLARRRAYYSHQATGNYWKKL